MRRIQRLEALGLRAHRGIGRYGGARLGPRDEVSAQRRPGLRHAFVVGTQAVDRLHERLVATGQQAREHVPLLVFVVMRRSEVEVAQHVLRRRAALRIVAMPIDMRDQPRQQVEAENQNLDDSHPENKFIAKMGGEALYDLLSRIDLDKESFDLRYKASIETSQQRKQDILKRLQVFEAFREATAEPKIVRNG